MGVVRRVPRARWRLEDRLDPNPRLQTWLSEWGNWRVEVDDFLELGDHDVVLVTCRGRGTGSGPQVRQRGAPFELREGKVVRLEIFADRERRSNRFAPRSRVTAQA